MNESPRSGVGSARQRAKAGASRAVVRLARGVLSAAAMNEPSLPRFPFLLSLLAAAMIPGVARAAETAAASDDAPARRASPDGAAHLSGLEVMLRPTIGGAGDSSPLALAPDARVVGEAPTLLRRGAAPYGTTFGAGLSLGYRFHPLVSAGLRGDISTVSAELPREDTTTDLTRRRLGAGLYLRAYPLALSEGARRLFDPWVATGVMYVNDAQSARVPAMTTTGGRVSTQLDIDHHTVAIPVSLGVDLRVTRHLSVGPSFEYAFGAFGAGCSTQSAAGFRTNRLCADEAGGAGLVADARGSWTAGVDVRFTPF